MSGMGAVSGTGGGELDWDDALMVRVQAGDSEAFGELVARHETFAWRLAYGYLGDRDEAEDVVQTAFLRLYEGRARYEGRGRFRALLKTVVSRLCLDHRSRKAPQLKTDLGELPAQLTTMTGKVQRRVVNRELREALESLKPRARLAVVLKYFGQQSYQEIAQVLEISPKAVESLLGRARAYLAQRLGSAVGPGEE